LGKCFALATGADVEDICGTEQLCSGVKAGIEGSIHAITDVFQENASKGWGIILVDAANAFNSVNRKSALWNARMRWPRCARFLYNTYRGNSQLIVQGTDECLYSKEGVTQGDPLSMLLYSMAVLPLIQSLNQESQVIQNWFADDASAAGELKDVKQWMQQLIQRGPGFGYYPEPHKSFLVVAPEYEDEANRLFGEMGIKVVTGQRFLGGFIGDAAAKCLYVEKKVRQWCGYVDQLASVAVTQPQAAFAALTKSLQCEWSFLQRVVPGCDCLFRPLEQMIRDKFLPKLFGGAITEDDRVLLSLPCRLGGLGIRDPTAIATIIHETSRRATRVVIEAIKGDNPYNSQDHRGQLQAATSEMKAQQKQCDLSILETLLSSMDDGRRRAVKRSVEEKTSSWLTVLPLALHHFDLSAIEFRDALALRYHRSLLNIPTFCDGCAEPFDVQHGLSCKRGGLIIQRHNEVRDTIGDLANLVWGQVSREPIVQDADDSTGSSALVADLSIRGVWQPQTSALLDIRVVDTDAKSYVARPVQNVLLSAETQKKRKYQDACEHRRATFTPFVTSVDGVLGREAKRFMAHLAERLATKWNRKQGDVTNWLRTRLTFATLRATNQCLRGTRRKWRSLGMDDGAPMRLAIA
jgi:hypothetical protein